MSTGLLPKQFRIAFEHELVIDLFAGGGGASLAMGQVLGRDPDIAINHDHDAIAMHRANHPNTLHFCEDVFAVDPLVTTRGRPVGLLHASPDCCHHSQARGGQPRSRVIRSLSWVVLKWAGRVKPRCITLENVEQILQWSPLVAKRDGETGRVIKIDRSIAAHGEQVPIEQQFLVPCARRRGKNWQHFVAELRRLGYVVQWRKLKACDFGAGTSRERLFLMARCDGLPIKWPKQTHGKGRGLQRVVTAADCIDWSLPCPSIFTRKKPLAEATLRRIAKGIKRFVIDAKAPFIVPVTHAGGDRVHASSEPLRTITTANRGEMMLCAPTLIQSGYGEREGQEPRVPGIDKPLGTVVAGGVKHAVVAAHLTAFSENAKGITPDEPLQTVLAGAARYGVVAAHLTEFRGGHIGKPIDEPMPTITAGGAMKRPAGAAHALGEVAAFVSRQFGTSTGHSAGSPHTTFTADGGGKSAIIECTLSPEDEAGALRVAAFLIRYYSEGGQWGELDKPLDTITTKDRIALVTVHIKGVPYVVVDIGLRMLVPPELFKAQGFPPTYIIDHGISERGERHVMTKTKQVRMVGNSVSPPPYAALLRANFKHEAKFMEANVA